MREVQIGDVVKFVDSLGRVYNALVIYVWPSCVNIVYVDSYREEGNDNYGAQRRYVTCVPWKSEGMSGCYVE
jgi:hypothetical protein